MTEKIYKSVKEVACDFAVECKHEIIDNPIGYSHVNKVFDSWFEKNSYHNKKIETNLSDVQGVEEVAVGFAEWMVKRKVEPIGIIKEECRWHDFGGGNNGICPVVTTKELYKLYLQSLTPGKEVKQQTN